MRSLLSLAQDGVQQLLHSGYQQPFVTKAFDVFFPLAMLQIMAYGIMATWKQRNESEALGGLGQLLFLLAVPYTMLLFYVVPMPGAGVTTPDLFIDSFAWMTRQIEAVQLQQNADFLDEIKKRFMEPGWSNVSGGVQYAVLQILFGVAKMAAFMAVAGPMIVAAALKLFGPFFIVTLAFPPFKHLFWNWLNFFMACLFAAPFAMGLLFILQNVLHGYLLTIPAVVTEDAYPVYVVGGIVVLAAFVWVLIKVPSYAATLFSSAGASAGSGILGLLLMK